MATLSGIQTRKQVLDILCKIAAWKGGSNVVLTVKPTYILVKGTDGKRLLSAIKGQGNQYSAQVSEDTAAEFSLPLWRNEPFCALKGE